MRRYLFWPIVAATAVFAVGVFQRPRVAEELTALLAPTGKVSGAAYAGGVPEYAPPFSRSVSGEGIDDPASDVVRVATRPRPTDRLYQPPASATPSPGSLSSPGSMSSPGSTTSTDSSPAAASSESAWNHFGAPSTELPVESSRTLPSQQGSGQRDVAAAPLRRAYPTPRQPASGDHRYGPGASGARVRPLPAVDALSRSAVAIDLSRCPLYPTTSRMDMPTSTALAVEPSSDRQGPIERSTAVADDPVPPRPAPLRGARSPATERDVVADSNRRPSADRMREPQEENIPRASIDDPVFAELVPIQAATQLARVGNDVILGSEVLPVARQAADAAIAQQLAAMPEAYRDRVTEQEKDKLRERLMRAYVPVLLQQRIESKRVHQDAMRNLPQEVVDDWAVRIGQLFEDQVLPMMIEEAGVASRAAYEAQLRRDGSSVETLKRIFIEGQIVKQWEDQAAGSKRVVTFDDLRDYYYAHIEEFETVPEARWRQLTVKFPSPRARTEAEARALLAALGDRVQAGEPFEEVARRESDGITASDGGLRSWTEIDSLRSDVLNKAIFGLPEGAMSRILKDEEGLHIVQVIERHDKTRTPFEEAQVEIKKKLVAQWKEEAKQQYRERLVQEIPASTIFDEQTADSRADGLPRIPVFQ